MTVLLLSITCLKVIKSPNVDNATEAYGDFVCMCVCVFQFFFIGLFEELFPNFLPHESVPGECELKKDRIDITPHIIHLIYI